MGGSQLVTDVPTRLNKRGKFISGRGEKAWRRFIMKKLINLKETHNLLSRCLHFRDPLFPSLGKKRVEVGNMPGGLIKAGLGEFSAVGWHDGKMKPTKEWNEKQKEKKYQALQFPPSIINLAQDPLGPVKKSYTPFPWAFPYSVLTDPQKPLNNSNFAPPFSLLGGWKRGRVSPFLYLKPESYCVALYAFMHAYGAWGESANAFGLRDPLICMFHKS